MSALPSFEPAPLSKSDAELVDAITLLSEWRENWNAARGEAAKKHLLRNRTRLAEQVRLMNYVNRTAAESLTVLLIKAEFELGNWPEKPRDERSFDCVHGGQMSVLEQLIATLRTVREPLPAAVMP